MYNVKTTEKPSGKQQRKRKGWGPSLVISLASHYSAAIQ
jgi:hypothetical protein